MLDGKRILLMVGLVLMSTICKAQDRPRTDNLGDPLPDAALLRMGTQRFQHPSGPRQVILSNDEEYVASIDQHHLFVWNAKSGKKIWERPRRRFSGLTASAAYGIKPAAVHPVSGKLVTFLKPGILGFWDWETGECEEKNIPFADIIKSIDISPSGDLIALGGATALFVCNQDGKRVFTIANNPNPPIDEIAGSDRLKFNGDFSLAKFSPDGKSLALVNSEKHKTIQVLDPQTGEEIQQIRCGDRVVQLSFSPDSRRLVTTERDISARLYDLDSGERLWEFVIVPPNNAESYTSGVVFRPDGKEIAVGAPIGSDYRIRLLNAQTGKETGDLTGCRWKPWTFEYTRNSEILYGSGWDSVVRRWNVQERKQIPLPEDAVRASSVCASANDGKQVAFVDDLSNIHLVELASGKTVQKFSLDSIQWDKVVFSSDSTKLAAGGNSADELHVVIWDLDSNTPIHHWKWNKGRDPHSSITAFSFSHDAQRIAAASFRQGAAFVWDLTTDQRVVQVQHANIYGMDLSADGTQLVTAGWDKVIREWNCDSGEELKSIQINGPELEEGRRAPDTRIYAIKFASNQSMIVTGDMSRSIRLYDRDLNPIRAIPSEWHRTSAVQFSNNGLWLGANVSGASIFDIATGDRVYQVDEHIDSVDSVDFGARDRSFLTGGSDGICIVWDLVSRPEFAVEDWRFDVLIGKDGKRAFEVFWAMTNSPEDTAPILNERFLELAKVEVSEEQIVKWIAALGSDNEKLVLKAKDKMWSWGPAAIDGLSDALESGKLSAAKQSLVRQVIFDIECRYRRAFVLLAELDAEVADEVLNQVIKTSRSKAMKQRAFEMKKHRFRFLKIANRSPDK